MWLPLKCDISNHVVKHRVKVTYTYFSDLSGLSNLSQIIWTLKNSLPLQWHNTATMPFVSRENLLWILTFCTAAEAELLENILWPVWSLTIDNGYVADLTGIQRILPHCCNYQACRNLMHKLVPNPFLPVKNPPELEWHSSKTVQRESQRPLPFLSTHHESRIVKSNAGGFQMNGQNVRSVWRWNWTNICSSVS